jgi:transposase
MLADLIEEEEMASSLPETALAMFRLMIDLLAGLNGKIADLDKEIARRAREDEVSRRRMTVPGIGPISATAIAALAPPAETFAKGRDFAAWLGLTPLQRSTGGKLLAQGTATELCGSGNAYVGELLRTPRRQAERLGKLLPRDGAA